MPTNSHAAAQRTARVPATNPFGLGATHGAEIAAVFGHPEGLRGLERSLDDASTAVIEQVQDAWATFATTVVPRPDWPKYGDTSAIMEIGASFSTVNEIRDGRCPAKMQALGAR